MEIAKYNEGEWFLEHSSYVDDMGLERNSMEVYKIREDGMKVRYPFFAPLRVSNLRPDEAYLGDDISPYETFEYSDMLRKQVKSILST